MKTYNETIITTFTRSVNNPDHIISAETHIDYTYKDRAFYTREDVLKYIRTEELVDKANVKFTNCINLYDCLKPLMPIGDIAYSGVLSKVFACMAYKGRTYKNFAVLGICEDRQIRIGFWQGCGSITVAKLALELI